MGLFSSEEEEREKRRAAEATEQAEWHRRQAAEARLAAEEARIDHENSIRWEQEDKEEEEKLWALAKSKRGDAILDLLHKFEEDNKSKKGKIFKAIKQWQVPTDKENFELFVHTFDINYDYIKELDWESDYLTSSEEVGLREMLIERAKKVARIYIKDSAPEAVELLNEIEQRMKDNREKLAKEDKKDTRNTLIGITIALILFGLLMMCQGY
ncbi:MAG: hypothetical protein IKR98_01655 [Bacteroidaceae bacterium]|nr:hypothetical protein [Bacteroidaceae bacterium]